MALNTHYRDLNHGSKRLDIHNSNVTNLCQSCEARHNGVCGALDDSELFRLSRSAVNKTIAAGTQIQRESEAIGTYAVILRGIVKLTRVLADGRQQIVGLQHPPDFLGKPFEPNSKVGVEAASEVKICAFPKVAFDRLYAEKSDLEHRVLKQTSRELDDAREWMLALGQKSAAEKVASFLLMIAKDSDPEAETGSTGQATFDLPLSRADIADFLGLTTETVSRQITRLREAAIIELKGSRHIVVRDLPALFERSGG